jgi:hypothetical protein
MMVYKTYARVTAVIFGIIAVLHLLRLIFTWEAQIGGWLVPVWLSVVAVIVAGWLFIAGLRQK